MAQNDMNLANASGASFRADINNAIQALASTSSGSSRPATAYQGQLWIDTDTPSSAVWSLYLYDGTDDIKIGEFDTTNNRFNAATSQASNVASAATINLDLACGAIVDVTGTTAITAITLAQGAIRIVRFTAALTLTHGASLVLPGAANITTSAGDFAIFAGYAAGVVRCLSFTRADGQSVSPAAHGQCRLTKSGSNLLLSPYSGNRLIIDGVSRIIPDAGVSLAPTSLVADTTYYIYAYLSGSTMTLEASTTAYSVQAGTGVAVKSTDSTRTLVGMARTNGSVAWVDSASQRLVSSYFNRQNIHLQNSFSTDRTRATSSYGEPNSEIRCQFLCWAEAVDLGISGYCSNSAAGNDTGSSLGIDSTSSPTLQAVITSPGANYKTMCNMIWTTTLSEGYHYATLLGSASAGTSTWPGGGVWILGTIRG